MALRIAGPMTGYRMSTIVPGFFRIDACVARSTVGAITWPRRSSCSAARADCARLTRDSAALAAVAALGRYVLVQAFGDLDKQSREQIAIGLHVAELGEHPLGRGAHVVLALAHLFPQALDFMAQAIREVA